MKIKEYFNKYTGYFIASVLFALLGGFLSWLMLRKRDREAAIFFLNTGVVVTVLGFILKIIFRF